MSLSALTAISPIDGRYHATTKPLSTYFSEFALIKYRVRVEVEYFIMLADNEFFTLEQSKRDKLIWIAEELSENDAIQIKNIERATNHDVKAIEYFLKDRLEELDLATVKEWIHFGLTSQDINNTAIPMSWKDAIEHAYLPGLQKIQEHLSQLAVEWKDIPMLARTHGQPASPTKLGKEFMVFVERLENQVRLFGHIPFTGKFGGATGNFNAHVAAYPKFDWAGFADKFLESKLHLERQQYTTQIEHYDMLAAHFDGITRINTILIDLARDIWSYISMEYFTQKIKAGEIGSSAMPHKVNPIDFENAEGNLGIANALWQHLSAKLPISRLQRDLTDSTVLRNIGVPMAHTILAFESLEKGLKKLVLNEEKLREDLDLNWMVVAEAIQTILRREKFENPYEALKELTRGKGHVTKAVLHNFIDNLDTSPKVKKELKAVSPHNYTGL